MIYESTRKMSVKEQEAYDLGYLNGKEAALRVPQPDPITGLVPCGCGGKALCSDQRLCTFDGEWLWRVECTECRVSTDGYSDADEAKAKWNRAMGWKGGVE